ncbi:DUF7793 family protein [Bizionia arctica]|nr:hypothetical protein [Bizionia arctica]
MEKQLLIGHSKFWIDKKIIYCKVDSDFNTEKVDENVEVLFVQTITVLSQGKFLPFLIDVRELDFNQSIKLLKLLSNCARIKSLILSKTFLVDSYKFKVLLSIYSFICNPIVPDFVFKNVKRAVEHCDDDNMIFNAVN